MNPVTIRAMVADDWPAVAGVYQEGVDTGNATFETDVPSWEIWDAGHLADARLVAEVDDEIVGWVALSPVSSRKVYEGVAEPSIYVATTAQGKGVGAALMAAVIAASEEAGFWTLQTAIFSENTASIALHERFGFRIVGARERIGLHHHVWRDTVLMERRSAVVGG